MARPKRQTDGDGRLAESYRNDRVEWLRKQVADGTYHVSHRSVADAMMRQGWEFVMARSRFRG
jgi:anti-sigma28 factor (negative regulator of flagellin synthesis)